MILGVEFNDGEVCVRWRSADSSATHCNLQPAPLPTWRSNLELLLLNVLLHMMGSRLFRDGRLVGGFGILCMALVLMVSVFHARKSSAGSLQVRWVPNQMWLARTRAPRPSHACPCSLTSMFGKPRDKRDGMRRRRPPAWCRRAACSSGSTRLLRRKRGCSRSSAPT